MPIHKRTVTPIDLAKGHEEVKFDELDDVTNFSLTQVLFQLASLARLSEDIFTELHLETCCVFYRTCQTFKRLEDLKLKIVQLNPIAEEVSLKEINEKKPFKSTIEHDSAIITISTRPRAIQEVYLNLEQPPPLQILDVYRDDGKKSLKFYTDPNFFFRLWKMEVAKKAENQLKRSKTKDKKNSKKPDLKLNIPSDSSLPSSNSLSPLAPDNVSLSQGHTPTSSEIGSQNFIFTQLLLNNDNDHDENDHQYPNLQQNELLSNQNYLFPQTDTLDSSQLANMSFPTPPSFLSSQQASTPFNQNQNNIYNSFHDKEINSNNYNYNNDNNTINNNNRNNSSYFDFPPIPLNLMDNNNNNYNKLEESNNIPIPPPLPLQFNNNINMNNKNQNNNNNFKMTEGVENLLNKLELENVGNKLKKKEDQNRNYSKGSLGYQTSIKSPENKIITLPTMNNKNNNNNIDLERKASPTIHITNQKKKNELHNKSSFSSNQNSSFSGKNTKSFREKTPDRNSSVISNSNFPQPPPGLRDNRSDLLQAIRQGIQLRKVEETKILKERKKQPKLDVQSIMEAAFELRRKEMEKYDEEDEEEEEWMD